MEQKELMTKRKIEKIANKYSNYEDVNNMNVPQDGVYGVFVSHSSTDNDFIRKVLLFLKYSKGGINGYVDWQDPKLQHPTDAHTAIRLKDRIKRAKKMIYVVTNESLKSVWCSWELGFADCHKGVEKIAIFAIKPNNGKWRENEYLQQYPWIQYEEKYDSFTVHMPNGGKYPLHEWLVN